MLGWTDGEEKRLNNNARDARGKLIENTTINILHRQRRQFHRNEIKADVENSIADNIAVETSLTTELASTSPGKPHAVAYTLAAFLRVTHSSFGRIGQTIDEHTVRIWIMLGSN